jgi:lipopolysaccharide transport system ATP-binding protein
MSSLTESRSDVAIRVEGVAKRYRIGATVQGRLLTERIAAALRAPARSFRRRTANADAGDVLWALQDVTFELARGEALGLVGRNGAGKSTLLKVISRITAPTRGRVVTYGRVATLLEVGTGFHPELTGRENIFLNGSILGMRRREIERNFDDIVEFAGIGRFLDTPVKRYSSGMFVRLAFGVAAHLEPDVLLVDEVLAVGDGEFQRKCLGRMREVAGEGRTVIFVSHNLNAVQRLCTRALFIDGGRVVMDGKPSEVVGRYLSDAGLERAGGFAEVLPTSPRFGTGEVLLRSARIAALDGETIDSVYLGQPWRVIATFEALEDVHDVAFEVGICNTEGDRIATAQSIDREQPPATLRRGVHEVTATIEVDLLPGEFMLDVGLHRMTGATIDWVERLLRFTALNAAEHGDDCYRWAGVRGFVRPHSRWSVDCVSRDAAAAEQTPPTFPAAS